MSAAVVAAALSGLLAAVGTVELTGAVRVRRLAKFHLKAKGDGRRSPLITLLVWVGRRTGLVLPGGEFAKDLDAAGRPWDLTVSDVAAAKVGSAVVVLVGGGPAIFTLPGRLPWLALVICPLCAFVMPDWLLARRAKLRAGQIERELPEVMDLLRISIEAGLPWPRAVAEVGVRCRGLLAEECVRVAAALQLGVARDEVLDRFARRCPVPGVIAFVAAVGRSERYGTPLALALAAQAGESRAARAREIAERAAKATPKIQLVIALLMVPSVLLMIAAALLASQL